MSYTLFNSHMRITKPCRSKKRCEYVYKPSVTRETGHTHNKLHEEHHTQTTTRTNPPTPHVTTLKSGVTAVRIQIHRNIPMCVFV